MSEKAELVKAISNKIKELDESEIANIYDLFVANMQIHLIKGKPIDFRRFGKFTVKIFPEKITYNPYTGSQYTVEGKRRVKFKVSAYLRRQLNETSNVALYVKGTQGAASRRKTNKTANTNANTKVTKTNNVSD